MSESISFELNGQAVRVDTDASRKLLWVLRTELDQTGTKYGCGIGQCGACTVLVDHKPARSCLLPVGGVRGRKVTTIEGLEKDGALHPLQQAFVDHDAMQCGFCTAGMILTAHGLLSSKPSPTRDEIIAGMDRNLCRCGAHPRIIAAIQSAASTLAAHPR